MQLVLQKTKLVGQPPTNCVGNSTRAYWADDLHSKPVLRTFPESFPLIRVHTYLGSETIRDHLEGESKKDVSSPWMVSPPYCSLGEALMIFVPDRCRCLHTSKNHACFATFLAYHPSSDDSNDSFKRLEYDSMRKLLSFIGFLHPCGGHKIPHVVYKDTSMKFSLGECHLHCMSCAR